MEMGDMKKAIDIAVKCAGTCQETLAHCLAMGGRHVEANHIVTMIDCAEICRLSADFMQRGSEHVKKACAACAEVCQHCANHCLTFPDDRVMRDCAEVCQRCAESCRKMAA